MNFAINYSTEAAKLVSQGMIEIDYFKCPDWPDMIAEASLIRPVAVHFRLKAGCIKDGRSKLLNKNLDRIGGWLEKTGTPYVNLHLTPEVSDYPDFPVDTPDPSQFEQVVANMLEDVRLAARRFGGERVIVENVPYRGQGGKSLRPAVEPAVIRQIVEETGCGLLLDISHARIAAHYLGLDAKEYIAQLPVERLRELHFTGLQWRADRLEDHLPVLEGDWPYLEWVMERIHAREWAAPWLLAFEYGGVGELFAWRSDPAVIAVQVPRLNAMVKDRWT